MDSPPLARRLDRLSGEEPRHLPVHRAPERSRRPTQRD